ACITVVAELARQREGSDAMDEAIRQAAEIRAGERAAPGADASAVLKMLVALTGETKNLEHDLAQSLGPDDARRLVYAEQGCWQNGRSGWGPRRSQKYRRRGPAPGAAVMAVTAGPSSPRWR